MITYLNNDITVEHHKQHIHCTPDEFSELWNIYDLIESTPNPINQKYMVKRKQCTFGAQYNFAGQQSKQFDGKLPAIVSKVLNDVKNKPYGYMYNVVHANFYPDGSAGLMPHSDDESEHVKGMPIYSYTFISCPGNPRGFQIYDKTNSQQVNEFMLDHGDLLIMGRNMQKYYKHGVKKSAAKKFKDLKRVNLTVRAWK